MTLAFARHPAAAPECLLLALLRRPPTSVIAPLLKDKRTSGTPNPNPQFMSTRPDTRQKPRRGHARFFSRISPTKRSNR